MSRSHYLPLVLYCIFFFLLTWFVKNNPFFWDTVQLASMHASFYYYTDFSSLLLPDYMDSGHPPLTGLYLAYLWKLFGRSLPVSHFAMLPFLFGTVYQCYRLSQTLFDKKWTLLVMSFVLLDATYLAQATLVSPDVILIFFFLFTLNSVYRNHRLLLLLGTIGLCLVSLRGMMMAVALMSFYLYLQREELTSFSKWLKAMWPWAIGGLFGVLYLLFHYLGKGWIGYFEGSSWAACFERVGPGGVVKNGVVLIWRMLDFGRLAVWLCILIGSYWVYKKQLYKEKAIKNSYLLFAIVLAFSCPSFLMYAGLNGHRYLLPVYVCAALLAAQLTIRVLFVHFESKKWLLAFFALFLSGHFWVYPDSVSKGWDSFLAYLPYFDLRQKMLTYIQEEHIPYQEISTCFPNEMTFDVTDLTGDTSKMTTNMLNSKYVFYSNVFNDYTDEDLEQLANSWTKEKEFRKGQVRVTLYKNPSWEGNSTSE